MLDTRENNPSLLCFKKQLGLNFSALKARLSLCTKVEDS